MRAAPSPSETTTLPPSFTTRLAHAARLNPAAVALAGLDAMLTYSDMLLLVRRAAWHLAAIVPLGQAVATVVPHTPRGVASLLGCLASGRVCIPLNPAEPAERLVTILRDAAPFAVIGHATVGACVGITLEDLFAGAALPDGFPPQTADGAPAIVHFTSGSSGQPKGIVFSLQDMLHRCDDGHAFLPDDRSIATSLPHTSTGLCLTVAPLLVGGRSLLVHLAAHGATAMLHLMESNNATCVTCGPVLLRMLLRLPQASWAFARVRLLRSGGAAISGADLRAWRTALPPGCMLVHRYASTEAGIVTQFIVPPDYDSDGPLPAGKPLPDVQITIDPHDAARPETGQLVVRGAFIARGEWRHGRVVADRIQPDPVTPGLRVFRTGDVFHRSSDGTLRFLGREDRQIKINGARIEPGEIEAVLRGHPLVRDALVLAAEAGGRTILHFFVAASCETRLREGLGAWIADRLPPVMRASRLHVLAQLPTLPSGKTDVMALRAHAGIAEGDALATL